MVIVRVDAKMMKAFIIIAFVASLSFNIYSYRRNSELVQQYKLLSAITEQLDDTSLIAFLASTNVQAVENNEIEIFDINKGSVIKTIPSSIGIQNEAREYLKGINGMYTKVKAIPDKGYIIRIPLEPSAEVKNQWLNGTVNEVFVILPQQGMPYLLVLDEKKRPFFYTFQGNIDELYKSLDFQTSIL